MMNKRWEYHVVVRPQHHPLSTFTANINKMGEDGWRVIESTYRMSNGVGSVMMEREKFG